MYSLLKKFLFTLDPELAHGLVKKGSVFFPKDLLHRALRPRDPALKARIGETSLNSPIGLAAGFDKNGEMIKLARAVGFGFTEIGSVTGRPCQGNPRPRIFRLPQDTSLINRMGLPNWGAQEVSLHLKKAKKILPYGINLSKTPLGTDVKHDEGFDEFIDSLKLLHGSADYIALNLSCPNTKDGRTFEDPGAFAEFASEIARQRKILKVACPVLVKISPDLEAGPLKKIVEKAQESKLDGFIVSNTTTQRSGLKTPASVVKDIGRGGLSGAALTDLANAQLKAVRELAGKEMILVGVGGIMNFEDLLAKMALGARLYEVYTGFVYGGPLFVFALNRKLARFCRRAGVKNYEELVGRKEILKMVESGKKYAA